MLVNKNISNYKHVYKLVVPTDQLYIYKFELVHTGKEQATYKLYSSNHSLMTIS